MNISGNRDTTVKLLKTYILQFIYKNGNGWAFINAMTPNQAEAVFKNQTKYEEAQVVNIKETKWYGENIQLVYEGAVTTYTSVNVSLSLSDLINASDAYASVEEYLQDVFLRNYYTKDETSEVIEQKVKEALEDIELPDIDLKEYAKKSEVYTKEEIDDKIKNIPTGQDGITPHIDEATGNWFIGNTDTGVKARGSFEDLTEEQKESLRGVGIADIKGTYGISTSPVTVPTSWSNTFPTTGLQGKYVWLKLTVIYTTDPTTSMSCAPVIISYGIGSSPTPGGGISVDVVNTEEEATAEGTLYFFMHSPLQGVGLYDILLKEKHIIGLDGKEYFYSPRELYNVYPDGSFDVINQDEDHFITTRDNTVIYNYRDNEGNLVSADTMLPRYGEIIVPHNIKYGDTADTIFFNIQVSGPFYEENTPVTIEYDSSLVEVKLITNIVSKVDTSLSGENSDAKTIYSPVTEVIPSGSSITFTNDNYYTCKNLFIVRKYTNYDELKTPLDTTVTFSTPVESNTVSCRFNKSYLFYSNGIVNPMSSEGVPEALANNFMQSILDGVDLPDTNLSIYKRNDYFWITGASSKGLCPIVKNFTINAKDKYVVYIKLKTRSCPTAHFDIRAIRDGWTFSSTVPKGVYYKRSSYESMQFLGNSVSNYGCLLANINMHEFKSAPGSNNAGFSTSDIIPLDAITFGPNINGKHCIEEIGIMKYNPVKEVTYDYQ